MFFPWQILEVNLTDLYVENSGQGNRTAKLMNKACISGYDPNCPYPDLTLSTFLSKCLMFRLAAAFVFSVGQVAWYLSTISHAGL